MPATRVVRAVPSGPVLLTLPFLVLPGCDRPAAPGPPRVVPPTAVVRPATPAAPPEPRTVRRSALGPGGTLDRALDGVGLGRFERQPLIAALAERLDARRLPAETGLLAVETPHTLRVHVRPSPTTLVRAERDETGWSVEEVELAVVRRAEALSGVVEASVAQALADSPHAVELTQAFSDIFQWDVDLFVDPRRGDRVRIVYELEAFGPLPEELPQFGELDDRSWSRPGRILAAEYDGSIVRSTAYWIDDDHAIRGYYATDGEPLRKAFLRSPLNYRRISSRFSAGRRHPITRRVVPHHGVDFAADPGTPVVATADGRVTEAGWQGALGRAVTLRHANGFETIYGHLQGFARGIRAGASVEQNEVIGFVGSTGRATGPHLHYTMRLHAKAIDPLKLRNVPAEPLPPAARPLLERAVLRWTPVLQAMRSPATSDGGSGP